MATFEAKVYRLTIEEHPNADALELAVVGDYRSIVRKGQFQTGDLGVYIPEAAVLPDWLIEELGLVGKLVGKDKNRVKAVKLRGILSQGLVYPVITHGPATISMDGEDVTSEFTPLVLAELFNGEGQRMEILEGDVVTDFLGITKYEPPIPVHMAGEVFNAHGMTLKYDIENIKRYPEVLLEGEEVIMTEKIHGTWACFAYHPDAPHHIITSKGLSEKGLAFKLNEQNANNLYIRALDGTAPYPGGVGGNIIDDAHEFFGYDMPFYILGEVFGRGVQDLHYGATEPQFRVFDIYLGEPGKGNYMDAEKLQSFCTALGTQTVPIVYVGPFSKDVLDQHTNGMETVSDNATNIREGVVVKPIRERRHPELGRVVLKSVSEAYLLRKGGTEFN